MYIDQGLNEPTRIWNEVIAFMIEEIIMLSDVLNDVAYNAP